MTRRRTKTVVPYSADQMFDLVADVGKYPEFLPHCSALRIIRSDVDETGSGEMIADMVVSYAAFRERFRSHVLLDREARRIEARYLEGPFRKLYTLWKFTNLNAGSEIDFTIDFEFRNALFQTAAAAFLERAFSRMADSFVKRADEIYGAVKSPKE